jgi:hypothetical protein
MIYINYWAKLFFSFFLGAIPALQQVMVATRGATDIFSGVGRHVNTSVSRLHLF